jgi:hypothetical protein
MRLVLGANVVGAEEDEVVGGAIAALLVIRVAR